MEIVLVIVGVVVFVGLILWIAHVVEKRRTAAMQKAAMDMGYSFEPDGTQVLQELGHFQLFQVGHSKRLKNVIVGRTGDLDFRAFDYQYTTGSGKNSSTHSHTVVVATSGKLHLPSFLLKPENVFHKIGGAFGYQDIDFDSHPKFSKKYLLRGDLEAEIRDHFAPHVLDFFQDNLGMHIEGQQSQLLFIRTRTKPELLRTLLDDTMRVHNALAR